MNKKDEKLVDSRLCDLGIQPQIFVFGLDVAPFRAIVIAVTRWDRDEMRRIISGIIVGPLSKIAHEKATRLREELRKRGIYGVAICDIHDRYNLPRGRTIAKGRFWKHLKQQGAK